MSSCFTVDVSVLSTEFLMKLCYFTVDDLEYRARAHKAIIAGSGAYQNSTMHTGSGNVNYVSYYVRRIQLIVEYSVSVDVWVSHSKYPDYVVLFKIPYREPLLKDNYSLIKDFILYKEPEKVLGYDVSYGSRWEYNGKGRTSRFSIDVTKPFIVGPNDYVGVYYIIWYFSRCIFFNIIISLLIH